MPLTDTAVKNAKKKDKMYRVADEKGLCLEVTPSGGKLWRYRYRFNDRANMLAMGQYPEIGLKQARERRDEARKLLANGIDPSEARKEEKAAKLALTENTFENVAREWFEAWREDKSETTLQHVQSRFERCILPFLGNKPVADIKAPDVLECLRPLEASGRLYTVKSVRINISQVLRHSIATGRRELADPCPYLKDVLKKSTVKHHAAFIKPEQVAELMRAVDSYQGSSQVCAALRLAPMLFVRPGEIIAMKWTDVDLEKAEWKYTISKTKTEHLVPLARQAVAILREMEQCRSSLSERGEEYVFPARNASRTGRHMSDMSINRALQSLGYDTKTEITGHGFRAVARTLLAEQLHFRPEIIEHQLAHKVPDTLGAAYNRTKYLKDRREMMQRWADYLDNLRQNG